MSASAAGPGLPAEWWGNDGTGDRGRQEMLRQVALVQAQQRRN